MRRRAVFEDLADRGAHVAGLDAVEWDRKGPFEQGVGGVAHRGPPAPAGTRVVQRRVTMATSARTSSWVRPERFSMPSE